MANSGIVHWQQQRQIDPITGDILQTRPNTPDMVPYFPDEYNPAICDPDTTEPPQTTLARALVQVFLFGIELCEANFYVARTSDMGPLTVTYRLELFASGQAQPYGQSVANYTFQGGQLSTAQIPVYGNNGDTARMTLLSASSPNYQLSPTATPSAQGTYTECVTPVTTQPPVTLPPSTCPQDVVLNEYSTVSGMRIELIQNGTQIFNEFTPGSFSLRFAAGSPITLKAYLQFLELDQYLTVVRNGAFYEEIHLQGQTNIGTIILPGDACTVYEILTRNSVDTTQAFTTPAPTTQTTTQPPTTQATTTLPCDGRLYAHASALDCLVRYGIRRNNIGIGCGNVTARVRLNVYHASASVPYFTEQRDVALSGNQMQVLSPEVFIPGAVAGDSYDVTILSRSNSRYSILSNLPAAPLPGCAPATTEAPDPRYGFWISAVRWSAGKLYVTVSRTYPARRDMFHGVGLQVKRGATQLLFTLTGATLSNRATSVEFEVQGGPLYQDGDVLNVTPQDDQQPNYHSLIGSFALTCPNPITIAQPNFVL